ncbi:MAG: YidC/Oxa1 family membrane protein insertase [Minisyncoccia bacterium]
MNNSSFFYLFLFKPIFNLLIFLYNILPYKDFGFAVILLTIVIKIIIFPLSLSSRLYQEKMLLIEPEIKSLQEKIKKEKDPKIQKEIIQKMMEIYKKEKVNPFFSIIPSIFQVLIFIALFLVFKTDFSPDTLSSNLYSFMAKPNFIYSRFLNIFDLTKPNIFLAIAAGIFQYLQIKMTIPPINKNEDFLFAFQKQMIITMPFFTFLILFKLPSVLGLYWLMLSLVSILEEKFIIKRYIQKYEKK